MFVFAAHGNLVIFFSRVGKKKSRAVCVQDFFLLLCTATVSVSLSLSLSLCVCVWVWVWVCASSVWCRMFLFFWTIRSCVLPTPGWAHSTALDVHTYLVVFFSVRWYTLVDEALSSTTPGCVHSTTFDVHTYLVVFFSVRWYTLVDEALSSTTPGCVHSTTFDVHT